jgi:UDP:flavonoid glycosyltransferase YjiC (YdhE family)
VKFALAVHGTRGDIEPAAAVGLELIRRGHEVRAAVPPNLIAFAETVGLSPALAYGVDSQKQLDADVFRNFWKFQNPRNALREGKAYVAQGWAEMSETLTSLADGADLILTGTTYQEVAANVAEHHRIPMAALHYFPNRINTHVVPVPLPGRVLRSGWAVGEWVHWQTLKDAEDAQRQVLGLPKATIRSVRRIVEGGALEIQAYDEVFFPGLAAEWEGKRPLVGSITMALAADNDDEVIAWATAGKLPIYFGFGSMPVESPVDAVAMIQAVCADLGERALISSGVWNLGDIPLADHVKLTGAVNHSAVFPLCRAVVHHGGAGTTAAGLRAGVPTVVLWVGADQPIWANQVKKLKVGTSQRFSRTTKESLTRALRTALTPQYEARVREVSAAMIKPAVSVATAADLLERAARKGGPGN